LQLSVVHTLPSLQTSAVPAVHAPLWHVSIPLQTLLSAQEVPFVTGEVAQPEAGLHVSAVQTLPSLQLSGVPAVQVPFWHVSAPLQTLLSTHDVPFVTGVAVHPVAGLHPSVVHTFPSLHVSAVPAVHTPPWHVSPPLHRLPSAHAVPLARTGLLHTPPVQTSLVHGLPSAQSPAPAHGAQPPIGVCWQPLSAWQLSVVQALPSLQLSTVPAVHTPP
jgi:hypothetical protein